MSQQLRDSLLALSLITLIASPVIAGPPPGKGGGKKTPLTLEISPSSTSERGYTIGRVSVPEAVVADEQIEVTSSDSTEASVPPTVVIVTGSSSVEFPISGVDDSVADGEQVVTITVDSANFDAGSATLTVVDSSSFPTIVYEPTVIAAPYPTTYLNCNDLNDLGMACGWYQDLNEERRAWFFDGLDMVDLNDLPIVGLEPNWIISSAVGLNNNGLIVGYMSPFGDVSLRRGYVLDLMSMQIYTVPDSGFADGYARKVNDNGDVLLALRPTDTLHPYLFNPGLRDGAAYDLDLISDQFEWAANLRDGPAGMPAEVVGSDYESGSIWRYTQGGNVSILVIGDRVANSVHINSYGDLAATAEFDEEVPLRKNKTRIVSNSYLYRNIAGFEDYFDMVGIQVIGFNDFVAALTSGGGQYRIYTDAWDEIEFLSLADGGSPVAITRLVDFNNSGPDGFGQVAGITTNQELVIYTAIATQ